jgi:hypothetical protein
VWAARRHARRRRQFRQRDNRRLRTAAKHCSHKTDQEGKVMKKHKTQSHALAVGLVLAASGMLALLELGGNRAVAEEGVQSNVGAAVNQPSVRSWPKDTNEYERPLVHEELLLPARRTRSMTVKPRLRSIRSTPTRS